LLLNLSRPVKTAFGITSDEIFKARTDPLEPIGEIKHFKQTSIPGEQAKLLVVNANAFADPVKHRLQQSRAIQVRCRV
jgi:hypothetical protein